MKLNFITFAVRDMNKSLSFYQDLVDLKIIRNIDFEEGKISFLANDEGETMIELIQWKEAKELGVKGLVLSFLAKEEELESLRERAINLGYKPSQIIEMGAKPKYFSLEDPDGIIIEFGI